MTITHGAVRATITESPREAHTTPVRFYLSSQGVMGIAGRRRGLTLHCHTGELWVTQQGDPVDRLLSTGETIVMCGRGRIVLQALSETVLSISSSKA